MGDLCRSSHVHEDMHVFFMCVYVYRHIYIRYTERYHSWHRKSPGYCSLKLGGYISFPGFIYIRRHLLLTT